VKHRGRIMLAMYCGLADAKWPQCLAAQQDRYTAFRRKATMKLTLYLVAVSLGFLAACVSVGVVETSDPAVKLSDASDLALERARPIPAERLIWEAIAIYRERGDEHGLANGYRQYGEFLRSSVLAKWETPYRRSGFQDPSVTFDNRIEKSKEYFFKALEHYRNAEVQLRERGRFDALSNVYFNMSVSYLYLDKPTEACVALNKSAQAGAENMRRNPSASPNRPPGYPTFDAFIAAEKKRENCP
jgi:hypothetical protein